MVFQAVETVAEVAAWKDVVKIARQAWQTIHSYNIVATVPNCTVATITCAAVLERLLGTRLRGITMWQLLEHWLRIRMDPVCL